MKRLSRRTERVLGWGTAIAIALLFASGLVLANANSDQKDDRTGQALAVLERKLDDSEATRKQLTADRERFQAQITTSINQLLDAGERPIIIAPDAVPQSVIDQPVDPKPTTTIAPPVFITPPVTEPPPTTAPPVTDPPTTDPPVTEPPATTPPETEPPETTTTTEPPAEESTTTTTTITEETTP